MLLKSVDEAMTKGLLIYSGACMEELRDGLEAETLLALHFDLNLGLRALTTA